MAVYSWNQTEESCEFWDFEFGERMAFKEVLTENENVASRVFLSKCDERINKG